MTVKERGEGKKQIAYMHAYVMQESFMCHDIDSISSSVVDDW